VYVWPTGAMAGSAGTFITLAGHAAAMVEGSTIGAASPVAEGGQELGDTIQQKITNILAADIENLARRRGDKAVEWARSAVTAAQAATAQEALALGVVDAVAENVDELLLKLDGFEVEVNGELRPLALAGAAVVDLPMTSPENTLNTLINAIAVPGIAVLLIVLGVQGIISEFSQPGGYMAGTAGFVALLLGMYALGILNANWVGLGFMLLSFVLFFLEIKAPTHGALTVAGVVTFIFGAFVLFSGTEAGVPWPAIIGLAATTLLFFSFVVAKAVGAQRRKPVWGAESLIGQQALVRTELSPSGTVVVQGERWQAELQDDSTTVQPGARVVVIERRGFKLLVRSDGSST
ncbi:MAG: nodulation protein NfeD, partial [Anaerolineae bacterium]|nr:nodulation protein NfeD [Anaerolineae bacterium]